MVQKNGFLTRLTACCEINHPAGIFHREVKNAIRMAMQGGGEGVRHPNDQVQRRGGQDVREVRQAVDGRSCGHLARPHGLGRTPPTRERRTGNRTSSRHEQRSAGSESVTRLYSHPNITCDGAAVAGACVVNLSAVCVVAAALYLGFVG